jgi:hypothetical protein
MSLSIIKTPIAAGSSASARHRKGLSGLASRIRPTAGTPTDITRYFSAS